MAEWASSTEEDASNMAFLCRLAAEKHGPEEQRHFLELLIADLTETHEELVHRETHMQHRPHQES